MQTVFMLLAQYEKPVVLLKDICNEYFGLSYQTARQRVNRPYFPRHLKSLKLRSIRRCYEQAA
uniref:pyocin activator PrtN family protein n=1 Tax=Aeromonas sanarellii TaxID=633415 RepID=UPI003BA332A5